MRKAKGNECECPICEGTGLVTDPRKLEIDTTEVKRGMAKKLRNFGYSFRQIQNALGYKSVRSVQHLLK